MFTLPIFRPMGKDYDDDAEVMPTYDIVSEVLEYRHPGQITYISLNGMEHRAHISSIILLTGN